MININCSTGKTLPFCEIERYPYRLKKHSVLEIENVEKSIREDGICFPITIGRVDGHNYIIDGEATYLALSQIPLEQLPEIPVVIVRCDSNTIKKMILISISTNHCVTKSKLEEFVKGTELDLRCYNFNEGELIDFHTVKDIDRYFESSTENNSNQKKYAEKLKGALI